MEPFQYGDSKFGATANGYEAATAFLHSRLTSGRKVPGIQRPIVRLDWRQSSASDRGLEQPGFLPAKHNSLLATAQPVAFACCRDSCRTIPHTPLETCRFSSRQNAIHLADPVAHLASNETGASKTNE